MNGESSSGTKNFQSLVTTLIALQITTLLVVAVGGAYLLYEMKQQVAAIASNTSGRPTVPETVENWRTFIREHNATQGIEDAEVVVIEFSDFQCPFCKRYTDETRRELVALYGSNVRMVFKHLPLEQIHPQAMNAAIAAQCARREGRFWDVHEKFFSQPNALEIEDLVSVGKSLGLSDRYVECIVNEETREEVELDIQDAFEIGVQGTPTFVVDGKVLVGAQPVSAFAAAFK